MILLKYYCENRSVILTKLWQKLDGWVFGLPCITHIRRRRRRRFHTNHCP